MIRKNMLTVMNIHIFVGFSEFGIILSKKISIWQTRGLRRGIRRKSVEERY